MTAPVGTLIGFDFGERRIGVAVLESALGLARGLTVIDAGSTAARFEAIDRIDAQWQPAAFVVGEPKHADGTAHPVALLAAKFGRRLAARYRKPVMMVDETLSSAEAESRIREESRDMGVDAVAAEIILQSYFDHPAHARPVA